ncbi:MAG TPA: MarR family transcriptional regulator [Polyangiaceae bacterium]|nr:MarR family transcriptional regulator [Polyangiaceae bacterium]
MPIQSSTSKPPPALEILDHLRRIVQALRESSRESERLLGVSGAQLFVLQTLEKSERLSLNALAERTHTHQSTVSVVVRRLVEQELVQSLPSASDRRRLELMLTPRGRSVLRRAPAAVQDRLVAGVQALRPAERRALAAALGKLSQAMQLGASTPSMFFEEQKTRSAQKRRQHAGA